MKSKSILRIANFDPSVTPSRAVKQAECWTQGLEPLLRDSVVNDTSQAITWLYFGTPAGIFRRFPGTAIKTCGDYDPRVRPWYIAATSGPKDVVLVLDVSGSMGGYQRIELARSAATTLLNTLGFLDYVNVITFSDAATVVGARQDVLIQATLANIASLVSTVKDIYPGGGTNYEAAFSAAFKLFEDSKHAEYTSDCQRTILFLTDGDITSGAAGQSLITKIQQLNTLNATIFMYTLGGSLSSAGKSQSQQIVCATNGLYTHIPDGGDLVGAMSYYYNYYATLRQSTEEDVYWSEPFLDAGGSGGIVTGPSVAVYDNLTSPPVLIGVVSMNIQLSYLSNIESNYDNILTALTLRSASCPVLNLDPCQLENFRSRDFQGTNSTDKLCGVSGCAFVENTPPVCIIDSNIIPYCDTPRTSYLDEECCSKKASSGVIAGAVVGSIAGVVIIAIIIGLVVKSSAGAPPSRASTGVKARASKGGQKPRHTSDDGHDSWGS